MNNCNIRVTGSMPGLIPGITPKGGACVFGVRGGGAAEAMNDSVVIYKPEIEGNINRN